MNRRLTRPGLLDFLTVSVAAFIYLGLTLYQLSLPGLYYDEAWDAVSTMQIVQNVPVELERGAHIHLLGRDWPLMLDDYQGTVSTYMLVPFFLIGGVNVASLRAFPILSGLLAVILCYFLARAWFGRDTARLAVLLFAVSTSWVFWSRIGVYVVAEVVPLTLGALLAFTYWRRSPRRPAWLLGVGSFLLGIGLSTKLLYIWPIVAIAVCFALLRGGMKWGTRDEGWGTDADGQDVRRIRHLVLRKHYALHALFAVVCFCAGAFPFLAYNWQTHGTYLEIRSRLTSTEYGANNTMVMPNLWEEADRFRQLLDGGYFWFQGEAQHPGDQGRVYKDTLAGAAFVLASLGLLAAAIRALPAMPAQRPGGRLLLVGAGGVGAGLLLDAAALARPNAHGGAAGVIGLLAVLLNVVVGCALVRAGLRWPESWARLSGWALLGTMTISGGVWFLVGRLPDGMPLGTFDLRLSDMSGLLFWFSLFALLLLLGWSAPASRLQRPLVATLGYLAGVLAQSFPTLSGLWATHLLVMLPMPQIIVAAAVTGFAHPSESIPVGADFKPAPTGVFSTRIRIALGTLATLALLASAGWTDYEYHRDLTRTGGLFAFSDGIYGLAQYLGKSPDQPVVAAEWGIRRQFQILSVGKTNPAEIFQYPFEPTPAALAAFDAALESTLVQRGTRYIFTAGTIGPAHRFPEFERVLAAHGLVPFLEHTSYQRNGEPIYVVYTARVKATP